MYSWQSAEESACLPPFNTFIIGIGNTLAFAPPIYLYNGKPQASAAARAAANETANVAFAPRLLLNGVPSRSSIVLSIKFWSNTFKPITFGAIFSFTLATAFNVPVPKKRLLSPSRSSKASRSPVEAPDGTIARPQAPDSVVTSHSTVGFPRESKTSRACTSAIGSIKLGI